MPPFARAPLTAGVRAPVPFSRPPGARHQARRRRSRRLVLALAFALLLGSAALVRWPRHPANSSAQAVHRRPATISSAGSGPAGFADRARPPQKSPSPPAHDLAGVLAALDSARARAFAARDPALLARVYSSPLLLARDRAALLRVVPPGCTLTGLHSHFADVHVEQAGSRTRVRARVAVRAAELVCGGRPAARAAPVPAVPMRIELRHTAAGYRIESEQAL